MKRFEQRNKNSYFCNNNKNKKTKQYGPIIQEEHIASISHHRTQLRTR